MPDIAEIVKWLGELPPWGVYTMLWFSAYIENLVPPSPSDVVMLFIATLIGIGVIDLVPAIAIATAGSVMGFLTAFWIGRRWGRRLLESGRVPFLTAASVEKVDRWFDRWGYGVIVVNRFLAGTRAVISFFAGMSRLGAPRTTLLCTVSALVWNGAIIVLGSLLGKNWEKGQAILQRYGEVVTLLLIGLVVVLIIRRIARKRTDTVPTSTTDASSDPE